MACRFPHAKDLAELWRVVREGEVTFEEIPAGRWNHASFFDATDVRAADKTYVRKGAFIDGHKEFAALHYGLAPRRVQVMDPQQRLLIEAVRQAMQDAGYEAKSFGRANAGVFFGISANEHRDTLSARKQVRPAQLSLRVGRPLLRLQHPAPHAGAHPDHDPGVDRGAGPCCSRR